MDTLWQEAEKTRVAEIERENTRAVKEAKRREDAAREMGKSERDDFIHNLCGSNLLNN